MATCLYSLLQRWKVLGTVRAPRPMVVLVAVVVVVVVVSTSQAIVKSREKIQICCPYRVAEDADSTPPGVRQIQNRRVHTRLINRSIREGSHIWDLHKHFFPNLSYA
ncbi:hypothetical protein IG631_15971 [Alternaria alternata]|nr:hypothetical protein IG631_15971 [Alternaria alternata]